MHRAMPANASPDDQKPTVVAIVGQTATGKTALGVALAKFLSAKGLPSEVVSADSQLIYKGLDIGTAKPTPQEMQGVPHHLIDVAAPDETFSVTRYTEMARPVLEQIFATGGVPIVVGGTGFYTRALLQETFTPDVPPNEALRAELHEMAQKQGRATVHARLQAVDPNRAAQIHPNDMFRTVRALEIIEATGKPVPNQVAPLPYNVVWLGLMMENRALLDARIAARVHAMLQAGWLSEVETLVRAYGPKAAALHVAHGYPELMAVLEGSQTLEAATEQIVINVRQYARRQVVWHKRNPAVQWICTDEQPILNPSGEPAGGVLEMLGKLLP